MHRLTDRLKYQLERWIQGGWVYQLAVVAAVLVSISVAGGALAFGFTEQFDRVFPAIWWAFLRLSDPGYLGDDEGLFLRTLSTTITVCGYVFFMGALVAIMTQWLHQRIRKLESGLTPIVAEGHIVVLGWTNRTAPCVRELLHSEGRIRRFLRRKGMRRTLQIVVMAENVGAELRRELIDLVGDRWDDRKVILRTGSSLESEDLARVDLQGASTVLLPGSDFELGGAAASDARVIKTLMTMAAEFSTDDNVPSAVAEILDVDKMSAAEEVYPGKPEIIPSDQVVGRLIAQTTRHRGLSYVYDELFSHERGDEIYVRTISDLAGMPFGKVVDRYREAIPLGIVSHHNGSFRSNLLPPNDYELQADDRLVFMAPEYEATDLPSAGGGDSVVTEQSSSFHGSAEVRVESPFGVSGNSPDRASSRRILVLGWNHKVAALIEEYAAYREEQFEVDLCSLVSTDEQEKRLEDVEDSRVEVCLHTGDYTKESVLASFDLAEYDNIVLIGSERLASEEETDARTILGFTLLQRKLRDIENPPDLLVELVDPGNAGLFETRKEEMLVTPRILSHMLAHVALRRELRAVFGEIFGPGKAEFYFRTLEAYGLEPGQQMFGDVQKAVQARGDIAVGVRYGGRIEERTGGVYLNPARSEGLNLGVNDEIVVLSRRHLGDLS